MDYMHVHNPPKAALITLGCPMNQVDSERIMGGLVSLGFKIVPEEEADIIVVNTCGFIEEAREESINAILSTAKHKKTDHLKTLVVAGCLAERYRAELECDLTEADVVVGLKERDSIPQLCLDLLKRDQKGEPGYSRVVIGPPHTAYLKIAEGCNNLCSYCAIPLIRGPYRSIPEKDILHEAEELVSLGAREFIIIAQDTTGYGIESDELTLAGLIRRLSDIEDIAWIRLLYAHPRKITDELIEAIAGLPKVLPYIDIPIQHISSNILRRMGRFTPPDSISTLIDRLRERIEELVIRTSLMVGFPGETDDNFRELSEFVERMRFERLGVFVYSSEEDTSAARMKNKVPKTVAEERYEILMEKQANIAAEFHHSLIGRELDMIVDETCSEDNTLRGRTYMDAPDIDGNIKVKGSVIEGNAFCRVRVTAAETYDLLGEVV